MPLPKAPYYTEEDYYNLPENVRAELIDGQIFYQAAPSRLHQKIVSILHATIFQYIKSKGGACEVYPAPFAVKLRKDRKIIVEPDISVICDKNKLTDEGCLCAPEKQRVIVYFLEKDKFKMETYSFRDTVAVNIYEDFSIDFKSIEL